MVFVSAKSGPPDIGDPPSLFTVQYFDEQGNMIIRSGGKRSHSDSLFYTEAKKKLNGCTLYVNAESCAMCSGAVIKSGINEVFYGAPYEKGSTPDIYLREINKKAVPKLKIVGGIMQEKFMEQIKRGQKRLGKVSIFEAT